MGYDLYVSFLKRIKKVENLEMYRNLFNELCDMLESDGIWKTKNACYILLQKLRDEKPELAVKLAETY